MAAATIAALEEKNGNETEKEGRMGGEGKRGGTGGEGSGEEERGNLT